MPVTQQEKRGEVRECSKIANTSRPYLRRPTSPARADDETKIVTILPNVGRNKLAARSRPEAAVHSKLEVSGNRPEEECNRRAAHSRVEGNTLAAIHSTNIQGRY